MQGWGGLRVSLVRSINKNWKRARSCHGTHNTCGRVFLRFRTNTIYICKESSLGWPLFVFSTPPVATLLLRQLPDKISKQQSILSTHMESESLNNNTTGTRKVRFAPKAPPRRVSKPAVVKNEVIGDAEADAVEARDLLRHFNENSLAGRPKVEKKLAPSQVAFGYGGASTSFKSHGAPKGGTNSNRYQGPTSDVAGAYPSGLREEKEYKEPWDYYSYYPETLPIRRPYSGNPELLDEEEFGEASESMAYVEDSSKPAIELGLMEENRETSMFFLQLPATMPMIKQTARADSKNEMDSSSKPPRRKGPLEKMCGLDDLPAGFMGKMLVYKSGAVKLKLGDTLYDVSPGLDCVFAQDVVAINTEEKHCCVVGELNKRAIIAPDVDSILDRMADLR